MLPKPRLARWGRSQTAAALGDVEQGVGPVVAVVGRVGQAADADGVQDDQGDAVDTLAGHLP